MDGTSGTPSEICGSSITALVQIPTVPSLSSAGTKRDPYQASYNSEKNLCTDSTDSSHSIPGDQVDVPDCAYIARKQPLLSQDPTTQHLYLRERYHLISGEEGVEVIPLGKYRTKAILETFESVNHRRTKASTKCQ